jgi:hypothetical protein
MSNARNLARLIVDSGGDVEVSSLGNVPPSNDASALTTGTLGTARLPAGSVLQVVQVNATTGQATSSTSYVDATGLSLNITPSSASSKILVMAHLEAGIGVNGLNTHANFRVFRDSAITVVTQSMRNYDYGNSGVYSAGSIAMTVLDAPNTTNPVNYKVQFKKVAGDFMYMCGENGWSTLTVMEIAG